MNLPVNEIVFQQDTTKRDCPWLIGNQHAKGHSPNKTSFKKGNAPWNKGQKGLHLSPTTEFKKGQSPANRLPVFSIVVRTDKENKQRQWIKIAKSYTWIPYAEYIWIKNFGDIPKGFFVHHKDENTLNDEPENLQLVTRAEHINIHRPTLRLAYNQKYGH